MSDQPELDAATAFEAGLAHAGLERGAVRNAGKVAKALLAAVGSIAQGTTLEADTAQKIILEANRAYTRETSE